LRLMSRERCAVSSLEPRTGSASFKFQG